ncbi:MAG: hypothetical protein KatS3mg012_0977 [Gaiellaceae bacterium]|jgi:hypothetical protein|nr:MAG: hypothetical protein KatS3mg012_0977 [Gaiellaceae bacterium]
MDASSSPVRIEGRLDEGLSRWLWLVKWLLAIPHYIVLAFLWAAFVVLTFVAFFAILFTGRYPRGIFDFNVGVLRWTWRVSFYSYGALATDRYPPFTLGDAADYPAQLEIAYPEQLSRGLVLVKWWLLAIPHYLVLAVLLGWGDPGRDGRAWPGLIALLVLFAGVALLFTTRYPRGLFDFVLGLDRWVARVVAYVALMTDAYPPFRLDQGGAEPATEPVDPPAAPMEAAPRARRGSAGSVVLVILGSIAAIVALGLLAGGCGAVGVDRTMRDDDGFLMSPSEEFATAGYAIASERAEIDTGGAERALDAFLGTVRITSESDRALFVGVAPAADVARYLGGVEHSVVTSLERRPRYAQVSGGAPATPPGEQEFWATSTSGLGEQTLEWAPEDGDWRIVVMNADGSRGVAAELAIGAELDPLLWIGIGLLAAGAVFAGAAALLITLGVRR